jgi:YegS/Rv2252/BmrU family lipid kinase
VKKFLLVYNPVSGDASFKYKLDRVIQRFQQRQCILFPYKIIVEENENVFYKLLGEISADGIVVAGGDGTIHEVVNGMMRSGYNLPLGIIPCGTSNDFAAYLQLDRDIDRCIDIIIAGKYKLMDIGKVNERYFFNVASAGLLASVAHNADAVLKNTLGKIAYYLKGLGELPNFRSLPMKITMDGRHMDDDIFLFLVANSSTIGGFPNLAPCAKIDDGLLDILVVKRCGLPELMSLFISFLKGTHHNSKHILYRQARTLYIECEDELESDLDGELGPKLPLTIEVLPEQLRIFCNE